MEIKTKPDTPDIGNLQKAADFVHAYILGKTSTIATALWLLLQLKWSKVVGSGLCLAGLAPQISQHVSVQALRPQMPSPFYGWMTCMSSALRSRMSRCAVCCHHLLPSAAQWSGTHGPDIILSCRHYEASTCRGV